MNIIRYIAFFCCTVGAYIHAELPFIYLKDLYNKVSKDYKHLSPVNGFHWWKLGIIENLYRFGDQNDETVKLIRELFYLQPWDNITFDITTLDNKPAKYLTSRSIGKILAFFEAHAPAEFNENAENEFKESLKQIIKDDLQFSTLMAQAQKKKEQHELQLVQLPQRMSEIDAELKRLAKSKQQTEKFLRYKQKNLEEMTRSGASADKIANLTESIKSDQNILDSINQKINQFTGYKEKFGEFGQMRKQITQDIAKENLTEKSLDRFIEHLVGCYKESLVSPNQLYPKFTFHQIMLGFLWKKVQQKPELVDYFAAFFNYNIPIVASSELLGGTVPEWLNELSVYTSDYFEKYKAQFPEENADFLLHNYELASFLMYGYLALGDFILPPIISSIADTRYKNYLFPDCVETSIRNLLNIAIFDTDKNVLDINALLEIPAFFKYVLDPTQSLIEFYNKNNLIETIDSDVLHDKWASVVSELPGVIYRIDKICNIKSGAKNTFKVINHILFGNDTAFEALSNSEKLDIFCKRLSLAGKNLRWESKDNIDDKQEFFIKFKITKDDKKEIFYWDIKSNHSVVSSRKSSVSELVDLSEKLTEALKINPESFQLSNLLGWVLAPNKIGTLFHLTHEWLDPAYGPQYDYIFPLTISINREILLSLKILCNALKLKDPDVQEEILESLFLLAKETNFLDTFTVGLINALPQDYYFQEQLLRYILRSGPERYYQFVAKIIANEPDESTKRTHIAQIIGKHNNNKYLIDLFIKTLRSFHNEQNVRDILNNIIEEKDRTFDTVLIENFDKILDQKYVKTLFYALSIMLDQKTIGETLEKKIREQLQILAHQMDIPSLIRRLPPQANVYVVDLVKDAIIRTQQQLKTATDLFAFNEKLIEMILDYYAKQLYPLAIEIAEKQLQFRPTPKLEKHHKWLLERQQQ